MRDARGQQRQGLAEHGQQPTDLGVPAARHERDDAGFRRDVMAGAKALGIAGASAAFQHRMTDEIRRQAMPGEERRLERQQAKQFFPQAGKMLHPAFPPGPRLGRDVVGAGNAERRDLAQDAQGESGAVDGHHHRRPALPDIGHGLREASLQPAQVRQHLQQSHQRQLVQREQAVQPLGLHPLPADAGKAQIGAARTQRGHQAGPQHVTARFAGDEVDQGHASPFSDGRMPCREGYRRLAWMEVHRSGDHGVQW